MRKVILMFITTAFLWPSPADASRLKDLVEIEGFRSNKLVGYGLVVGLSGTGDSGSSVLVKQSMANLLKRLGTRVTAKDIKAKNVAVVLVTAELPAFARPGMKMDVLVSSSGEAKSLQGGVLIATALKGPDRKTYAIAQGAMSSGGFAVKGLSGSSSVKNHPTAGRIPGGAMVEVAAPTKFRSDKVTLLLKEPDFTTASRIAKAIDATLSSEVAIVRDPGSVTVMIHPEWRARAVHFVATLESIHAIPDVPARVIVDERTGTVVVGAGVTLSSVAVAHGALTVTVAEGTTISQPGGILSGGETATARDSKLQVTEETGDLRVIPNATTVGDVASALNALGAKPRDLVSIFQALKAAGALRAEIQIL
ncbi:MAG: flagellar basal body P-ring protein FlgI [Myxococcales bacterium]|nr:flagellar basal body P-ring protein FlgI [Myxococcales bacterium]